MAHAVDAVSSSAGLRLVVTDTRQDSRALVSGDRSLSTATAPNPGARAAPAASSASLPSGTGPATSSPQRSATSSAPRSAASSDIATAAAFPTLLPDSLLASAMAKADAAVMLRAMQAYRQAMRELQADAP